MQVTNDCDRTASFRRIIGWKKNSCLSVPKEKVRLCSESLDDLKFARYANTSPNTALDWKKLSFSFTGNGCAQTIRIVSEASTTQSNGRGAMIDNTPTKHLSELKTGTIDSMSDFRYARSRVDIDSQAMHRHEAKQKRLVPVLN